uniref:RING-type domain-containing protein n=1 Tax=Arundo donax TaxID=35708 RepID=A0A0A9G1R8_ARUDO
MRLALENEISLQNEALLNIIESMASNALMQKNDEIAHLRLELQNTQEFLRATLQDRDGWMHLTADAMETNQLLISQFSSVQGTNAHGSSNDLESTGSCNQALNIEGQAIERTYPSLVCKVCSDPHVCTLILPCRHLCTCKSCGANLATCPICYSAKVDVIEVRFV